MPFRSNLQPLPIQSRLARSEEHTSELQSRPHLVCRLLLEKKKNLAKRLASSQRPFQLSLSLRPTAEPACREHLDSSLDIAPVSLAPYTRISSSFLTTSDH